MPVLTECPSRSEVLTPHKLPKPEVQAQEMEHGRLSVHQQERRPTSNRTSALITLAIRCRDGKYQKKMPFATSNMGAIPTTRPSMGSVQA